MEDYLPSWKKKDPCAYMYRPPVIKPNYGNIKKQSVLPKTHVAHVILFNNTMPVQTLNNHLKHIETDRHRINELLEIQKQTFIHKQMKRHMIHVRCAKKHDIMPQSYIDHKIPIPLPTMIRKKLEARKNLIATTYGEARENRQMQKYEHLEVKGTGNILKLSDIEQPYISQTQSRVVPHKIKTRNKLPPISVIPKHPRDDPRFRNLTEILTPNLGESDNYLELSPSYESLKQFLNSQRSFGSLRSFIEPKQTIRRRSSSFAEILTSTRMFSPSTTPSSLSSKG
ncbi:hypothetical protein CHS0354_010341 [Potamilus streckersoni]|uniref:Uncharacterized protein n=1 Tax=Potamilus streckersoni TaxID=2493646 RepID=A0AAE0WCH1_9BIVA|nr:hypothetical protein CHS0354_010341 [Potamilus streckersoni]